MSFFRNIFITFFLLFSIFLSADFSHADSWDTGSMSVSGKIDPNNNNAAQDDTKIKQDIQAYIIESYKAQWAKILKDLDVKLQKTIPDRSERQDAYGKIRDSLEIRKKKIDDVDTSIIKKEILSAFIDYMIGSIDEKIQELDTE